MKTLLLTALAAVSLSSLASAVYFDTNAFGQSLNSKGWGKKRTATYSIDSNTYRTHVPTMTPTPGGGMFVSTRVDYRPRMGKLISSYLELTFTPEGHLVTGQIRLILNGKRLNTGQVNRQPNVVAAPAEEGSCHPQSHGKLRPEFWWQICLRRLMANLRSSPKVTPKENRMFSGGCSVMVLRWLIFLRPCATI